MLFGRVSAAAAPLRLALVPALGGRAFDKPLFLTWANDGSGRRFVVEQGGRIYAVDGADKATLFLDLSDRTKAAGEKGLLGLAFSPRFRENGRFYVFYSAPAREGEEEDHHSVLSRFHAPPKGPADRASEKVLLRISKPWGNHNGGCIAFGPDGYLYVGSGDGGSAGDPRGNAQRLDTLLGKILRIDVDGAAAYGIPGDNPFAGRRGIRGEIWAYGLRNPWRFSFDRETGRLWAGDVGQNAVEEIDLIEKGKNYGWRLFEGSEAFKGGDKADRSRYAMPAAEYRQGQAGRCVTGGYVYRGKRHPALRGAYLYGDYVSGRIRGFRVDGKRAAGDAELLAAKIPLSSFGEDEQGELYAISHDGPVFRIISR